MPSRSSRCCGPSCRSRSSRVQRGRLGLRRRGPAAGQLPGAPAQRGGLVVQHPRGEPGVHPGEPADHERRRPHDQRPGGDHEGRVQHRHLKAEQQARQTRVLVRQRPGPQRVQQAAQPADRPADGEREEGDREREAEDRRAPDRATPTARAARGSRPARAAAAAPSGCGCPAPCRRRTGRRCRTSARPTA